jgi:uncharacterized membrane protein YbhN (UPF0104 family)
MTTVSAEGGAVRSEPAGAPTGTETPGWGRTAARIHLPRLPKVNVGRILLPVATAFGIWLLVEQLAGLNDFKGAFSNVTWAWAAVVLVMTQVTVFTEAVAMQGSVPVHVPLGLLSVLRASMDFTGFVGGTVGRTATVVLFYKQRGLDAAIALSSGLLYSVSGFVVQVLFTVVLVPVAGDEFHRTSAGPSGSGPEILQIVLYVIVAAGVIAGIAAMVPRIRRAVLSRFKPQFQSAWANVRDVLSSPRRVALLLTGSAATQLLMAAGLALSLHAVGGHASFGAIILVCTFTALVGGMAPIPAGLGVMEACYIAGLTLLGVPQDLAIAATLIYRVCTTYLPPVWGWGAMVWLRRRGAL